MESNRPPPPIFLKVVASLLVLDNCCSLECFYRRKSDDLIVHWMYDPRDITAFCLSFCDGISLSITGDDSLWQHVRCLLVRTVTYTC